MTDACGCRSAQSPSDEGNPSTATICARDRVGEVARSHPGALGVMQELGIDACCGAGLTLVEAAGAAGIPLERLLEALHESVRTAP